MSFEQADRQDFRRWVRATFTGWLLGFVLVIVVAVAWDMIGGGAQFMVGVGMGAGVGYMQSRVVGEWVDSARPWLWASILGMGTPFVLWDIGAVIGIESFFSLPRCVVIGGLLVGLMQRRLLSLLSYRANWWVPACVVGWSLPAGAIALGDSVAGGWGSLASVAGMLLGGAVLGAVTGGTLIWLRRRPAIHNKRSLQSRVTRKSRAKLAIGPLPPSSGTSRRSSSRSRASYQSEAPGVITGRISS